MRILLLMLLSATCIAQSAAVPSLWVPVPAQKIPAQKITFTVPPGGGSITIQIPQQTLPSMTLKTSPVSAPVSLGTLTFTLSCTAPLLPNGQPDLTKLSCKLAQQ